MEEAKDLDM